MQKRMRSQYDHCPAIFRSQHELLTVVRFQLFYQRH
jgi:hypothetical protein